MTKETICIQDRKCVIRQQASPSFLLIQPVDEHDLEQMEDEVAVIKELSDNLLMLWVAWHLVSERAWEAWKQPVEPYVVLSW